MDTDIQKLLASKVLVTGATGFTGGRLARRLLGMGVQTTVLVRETSSSEQVDELGRLGARVVFGDVTNPEAVRQAVQGQDYVFHLAALFRQAKFPDSAYVDVNVTGTVNVVQACNAAGVQRLIHCSTNGVHGNIQGPPANENAPFKPGDKYQESKLQGEIVVRRACEAGEIDAVVIRPAMIWGEGDRRIFKMFRGVSRRCFPVIGDGKTWMHWLYIEDLIDGFLLGAVKEAASGQVYLLAGRRPVSLEYTVQCIAKLAGVSPLPFKIPAKPVQILGTLVECLCQPFGIEPPIYRRRVDFFVKNRCFDTTKAQRELGFTPRYEFEDEARIIYTWYKENGWL